MSQLIQIQITPEQAKNELDIRNEVASFLNINDINSFNFKWKKRSLDARKKQLKINASLEIFMNNEVIPISNLQFEKKRC